MELTQEQLQEIMPKATDIEEWMPWINESCEKYQINTDRRMSAFLANIAVESGELSRTRENMNYSAQRLCQVFPRVFPSLDDALPYAHNQNAIANAVYGGKMGNAEDEGALYLGRGLIQLTGKDNYTSLMHVIGVDIVSTPEIVEEKQYAALTAAGYWYLNDINTQADDEDLRAVRKKINRALLGLAETEHYYKKAMRVFNA